MLKILVFVFDWVSDDNVDDLAELLEILDDLLAGYFGV
jgi:hypothetical protein